MSNPNVNQNQFIDLSNINPNKVLEFSFNYELLKYVLSALINNQQNMSQELSQLKLSLYEQQKYSGELESQIIDLKIQRANSPEELEEFYSKKKELDSKNNKYNIELEFLLKQKEENIPQKTMEIYTMKKPKSGRKKEFSEQELSSERSNNINETEKTNEKDNKDANKIVKEKKEKKEKVISSDNLVNKNDLEDINKKIELSINDISSIKSSIQTLQQDLSSLRTKTSEQSKENMEKNIPKLIEEIYENKITGVKKYINNDVNQLKENMKIINEHLEEKITKLNNETKEIESLISQKFKKDFEEIKNNYDKIKNSLSLNSEKLSNTVTPLAFANARRELEEKIEIEKKFLSVDILDLKSVANSLKNQLLDHLNDSRDRDNIANIMRIIESITGNINRLMDFKKMTEEKEKRKAIIDNTKYVKPEQLNEAINNLKKMIENNKKEFSEIRFDMANIRENDLSNKASLKDLKGLEDAIFERMEKLKDIVKNNFVEKTMLVKNLKYIEYQTKHLIEENKKVEKQDNWLLAKKPVNGHLCASCEAYLGDLKPITNSNFISWNKYPQKNFGDFEKKIFKVNAGFSKVLQMINQDTNMERSKSNSVNVSKEERDSSSAERNNRRKIPNLNQKSKKDKSLAPSKSFAGADEFEIGKSLPKILMKNKNKVSGNYTTQNKNFNTIRSSANNSGVNRRDEFYENLKDLEEIQQYMDERPKITKIYKKKGYSQEKTE